jgi:hypothetical protein
LAFVGFQLVIFVALTWLALGVRTKVWDVAYWWSVPLLLIQFAIFYSFSVLLAVVTRSTVACVFGCILFWLLAWGINYGSIMARHMPQSQYLPSSTVALAQASYWITPKPIDAGLILFNALNAKEHFEKPSVFKLVESGQEFSPQLSILSSLVMTGALLARIGISRFFQASQGSGRATSESARGPRRSAQNRSMPNRAHFSQTELTPRGS